MSRRDSDSEKVPAALYDRLTDTPTYAARMYKVQLGTNKAARWRASKANIGLLHQRPAESSRGAIMLTQTKIQEQSRDDLGMEVGIEYDD